MDKKMKLENASFKRIKVYTDLEPWQLEQFRFQERRFEPMLSPNFKEFSELLCKACTGLNQKKAYSEDGKLVVYRRFGYVQVGGWDSGNHYCTTSSAFDLLEEGHIDLVDKDNPDGIECLEDFFKVKRRLMSRMDTDLGPVKKEVIASMPKKLEIADTEWMNLSGGERVLHVTTKKRKMSAKFFKVSDRWATRKDAIEHPINLELKIDNYERRTIKLHPLLRKGKTKTITEMCWKSSRSGVVPKTCLTEFDLNATMTPLILKYNEIIQEFNDSVEELKKKYLALYMLNCIGTKASII